mmetsp:Transcript_20329/g.52476  ORF Transcript_20329/g.52476 Transcript_20329/m.52476 type:complete len:302 (-) Transcript_20329:233-1138(-)
MAPAREPCGGHAHAHPRAGLRTRARRAASVVFILLAARLPTVTQADAVPDPVSILTGEANERAQREAEEQGRDHWLQFDVGVHPSAGDRPVVFAHARGKRYDALKTGLLLVATPKDDGDSYFARTVLLVTRHEPDAGTHALILNKPTRRKRATALGELEEMLGVQPTNPNIELLDGGPVPTSMPSYAYPTWASANGQRCAALAPSGAHLEPIDEVRVGPIPDAFLRCLLAETSVPVKIFFGISGWAPLQLDGEYRRGDWVLCRATQKFALMPAAENAWSMLVSSPEGFALCSGVGLAGSMA